ncbi:MAG: UDP-N-acetylglucosamine 2-epimerase [Clostridia bacterium]|nr:UDP-N-acetylglucosamine 2-epimerase [Clostridia bacterium]
MKFVSVVGARPQFIKCAPISRELRQRHEEILVHTGQHYDNNMSDIFFNELGIPVPNYNLGVGSSSHGEQTGKMLHGIEKILLKNKPDMMLVYGDTNSTLAGSLAAAKLQIPVAHIEAGLRSFDRSMPEELNRVLTDHASSLLFCPTATAVRNLKREGIVEGVHNVGDVMMDALLYNIGIADEKSNIIERLHLTSREFLVVTVHRASNTDNIKKLSDIVSALCSTDTKVVFPVHPRTEKYLKTYGLWEKLHQNVELIPPLGYIDMLKLMVNAKKIITDSGGVQKEAYMLGVPCITLRENTEWMETVEDGWNVLVGSDYTKIMYAIDYFTGSHTKGEFFGKGNTASIINSILNTQNKL